MVTGKVAPLRVAVKSFRHIAAGHLLGTVADELWEIASVLHPASTGHRSVARCMLRCDALGLGGGGTTVWSMPHVFSFFRKQMSCRGAHLSSASEKKRASDIF